MAEDAPTPPLKPVVAVQFLPPLELYSIVLAGNHDPRQHHPFWYKLIELLDDDELKVAISNAIATPELVMFDAGVFSIICNSIRWQISTMKEENCPRMLTVATKVFDEKLFQVSITAIGTNCVLNPETSAKKIGPIVVGAIESGGLVPPIEGKSDGSAVVIGGSPGRVTRAEIGESVHGPSRLAITFNVHRELQKREGYYTIAGELQHCESDWRHGKRFVEEVRGRVEAIVKESSAS